MTDKHWKAKERFIAKKLKGKRIPMHGDNHSDVESDVFCAEVTVHSLPKWIEERLLRARAMAQSNKLGICVICIRDTSKGYVVIDLDDFEEWYV